MLPEQIPMFASCPNCYGPLNRPLLSGLRLCKKCGWRGKDIPRRPPKPVGRDIGLDAIAAALTFFKRLVNPRSRHVQVRLTGSWIVLPLLFLALAVTPVVSFMSKQQLAGHPIDPNYFWAALDFRNWFGPYNGSGGKDWKIGEPLANGSNGLQRRTLSEERAFALQLVNRDRALNGRRPLSQDPTLDAAAQQHAMDMLKRNYFAHNSPDGSTPTSRYLDAGGDPRAGIGENICQVKGDHQVAVDFNTAETFQKGWMYSDGHRSNLLDPSYRKFGYGIVTDRLSGRAYAAQEFAIP